MRSFTFFSTIALTLAGFAFAAPTPVEVPGDLDITSAQVAKGPLEVAPIPRDIPFAPLPPAGHGADIAALPIPVPRDIKIDIIYIPELLDNAIRDLGPVLELIVNLDVDELTVEVLRPITDRVTLILEVLLKGVNNLVGRPIKEVLRTADGAVMTVEQLASRVAEFLILVLRTIATLLKHTLLEEVAAILRGITTLVNDVLIAILKLVVGLDVAIVPFIGDLLDVLSSVGIKISL